MADNVVAQRCVIVHDDEQELLARALATALGRRGHLVQVLALGLPVQADDRTDLLVALGTPGDPEAPGWHRVLAVLRTADVLQRLRPPECVLVLPDEPAGAAPVGHRLEQWTDGTLPLLAAGTGAWRLAARCRELADLAPRDEDLQALLAAALRTTAERVLGPAGVREVRVPELLVPGGDDLVSRWARAAARDGRLPRTGPGAQRLGLVEDLAGAVGGRAAAPVSHLPTVTVDRAALQRRVAALVEADPALLPVQGATALPTGVDPRGVALPSRYEVALAEVVACALRATPLFDEPCPLFVPVRPQRPDVVADRTQQCLWSGRVRQGHDHWSADVAAELHTTLGLPADRRVLMAASGTAALRLAVVAVAGSAAPGDVAVLPSFTFAATGEALRQLGYSLRFCDVEPGSWTLSWPSVEQALREDGRVRLVVTVDALGVPADYRTLVEGCRRYGVPLVADSAPGLGAESAGSPLGSQADAHAFSLSFAKTLHAGGAGGFAVIPAGSDTARNGWLRSSQFPEPSAVVVLDQLPVLASVVARRAVQAALYDEVLARHAIGSSQQVRPGDRRSAAHWAMTVPSAPGRTWVAEQLLELGVQTRPYYLPCLHRLLPGSLPGQGLPVTAALEQATLSLPVSSEFTARTRERLAAALDRVLSRAAGVPPGRSGRAGRRDLSTSS